MDAGYQHLSQAKQARWPIPEWHFSISRPQPPVSHALTPTIPELLLVCGNPFFMSDGSWFDDGRCGGCFAVGSRRTYEYHLYEIDIPLYLDHSFVVEQYVAWTALCAHHANLHRPEGLWVTKASSYIDCLSYILALESSNHQCTPSFIVCSCTVEQCQQHTSVPPNTSIPIDRALSWTIY